MSSSIIFTKDLPQSSLKSDDGESLCMDKFTNPPRTLYDEIGDQSPDVYDQQSLSSHSMDWQTVVKRLQNENTSLVLSLHDTHNDLKQSRNENRELEQFIQRHIETSDMVISRLRDTVIKLMSSRKEDDGKSKQLEYELNELQSRYNQLKYQHEHEDKEVNDHLLKKYLDIIFQKEYLMKENAALRQNEVKYTKLLKEQLPVKKMSALSRLRSHVYALIAVHRLKHLIS
ncbi:hypothetical protein BDB01DRAFT_773342 [Pilobolus umbonatus]|nr:hypothetical protein BDB01DRAFT_773342 [Pilobolus umbonatus]